MHTWFEYSRLALEETDPFFVVAWSHFINEAIKNFGIII